MRAAGALRGITTLREQSEYRMSASERSLAASEQSLGQRRHGKFFSTLLDASQPAWIQSDSVR